MHERAYRQRLEADLARWQADGLLPQDSADAIRSTFKPVPEGVTIATVVGIVGGLLIAAAFLAFVAANWTAIPRSWRFMILLAGIFSAYGIGAYFDRTGRAHLADLAAGVASIIFGAAIALTGQMYHLGGDFAAGMLLWAAGSLAAAALTSSRAALAVALVTACIWSGMRISEMEALHLPFAGFWILAALLALAWNAHVARHLVGAAALAWSVEFAFACELGRLSNPVFGYFVCVSLLFGGGLLMATRTNESVQAFGLTVSTYSAFGLALGLAFVVTGIFRTVGTGTPMWLVAAAVVAVALALAAAGTTRRLGPALAGIAMALALVVSSGHLPVRADADPWVAYALTLAAMLCIVISGMLDDVRPRVVAGWLGLAGAIAAITWSVRGSLLRRAVFLAVAGLVAVALASLLGRFFGRERRT